MKPLTLYILVALVCAGVQSRALWSGEVRASQLDDSATILKQATQPSWSSGMWGGPKPTTVPLFYRMLDGDSERIVRAQWIASILAWGFLGLSCALATRSRIVGVAILVLTTLLSASGPISSWNTMMLTESLSLSLLALLVGASLWLVQRPGVVTAGAVIVIATLCAFSRDTCAYLLLMLAVIFLFAIWPARNMARRALLLALALSLVGIWAGSVRSAADGRRWLVPFYNILSERILPYPERVRFFASSGMPVSDSVRALAGRGPFGKEMDLGEGSGIAALREWTHSHGQPTYARFLLLHPAYLLMEPLTGFWGRVASRLDKAPGGFKMGVVGHAASTLRRPIYFLPAFVLVALATAAAAWIAFRRKAPQLWVPVVMLILTPGHVLISWHGDACEVGRHSIVAIAQAALGTLLLALFAIDLLEGGKLSAGRPSTRRSPKTVPHQ